VSLQEKYVVFFLNYKVMGILCRKDFDTITCNTITHYKDFFEVELTWKGLLMVRKAEENLKWLPLKLCQPCRAKTNRILG